MSRAGGGSAPLGSFPSPGALGWAEELLPSPFLDQPLGFYGSDYHFFPFLEEV